MARNQVDEAIADLDQVPDGHPMAAQARLQTGQLDLRRNRYVAAEVAFLTYVVVLGRRAHEARMTADLDPELNEDVRPSV